MKRKIRKNDMKKKAQEVKDMIDGIVNETVHIPDNAVILDTSILIEIFTKKRMELMQFINKFKPQSVQELAVMTKRKKQAVDRDLKILERHDLLVLEKDGRKVVPKMERKFLVIGLGEVYPLGNARVGGRHHKDKADNDGLVRAQVYVDGVNVNQKISEAGC